MNQPLQLTLEIDQQTAWALAQFVKRSRFDQYRDCAVDDDEAYLIRDGVAALEKALADRGFAPR
jgi:hypothetical protein